MRTALLFLIIGLTVCTFCKAQDIPVLPQEKFRHYEFSVSGVEDERVAERNVERITICRRVASEQDRRQEEDEQFFHTGYLNGLNPS